jgi:RNA polymerase sigma-70 factor (ECF subfamily)
VIPPPPAPDPEWLTARKSAAELVADFIAGLSAKQREVFVLADVEGFSGPEIATMLAIPVTAVHARLRAARLKFERLAQGRTEEGTP